MKQLKNRLAGLLCAAVLLCSLFVPLSASAMEPAGEPYRGIDVSEWQGDIDFSAVRASGIETVYIRSTFGADYVDPRFQENCQSARAAGMRFGVYHYLTARNEEQARQQAHFFVAAACKASPDMRLAMDFESFGSLTRSEINAVALAFLSTVEELCGHIPAVYSNSYDTQTVWDASLSRYPLWVAEWGAGTPSDNPVWDTWVGFQYSNQGNVPGIAGRVDLDTFTSGAFLGEDSPMPGYVEPMTYTVVPGDTLWDIARRFGTTAARLAALNDIANPNLIYPGEVFLIE